LTASDAIARFERCIDQFNQGDLEGLRAHLAREFFAYSPKLDEPDATEVFSDILAELRGAFSDLRVTAQDLRDEGGLVKGQLTVSGTHDGGLWGAPGSGKRAEWAVDVAARPIGDGFALALENLALPQIMGLFRQLELVPPPDQMDRPPKHPLVIPENLLKVMFNGQAADKPCSHLDDIRVTESATKVCQDCVDKGDIWPALRMCLICGYVGCCDTSKNKHMKQHYEQTGHPLFRSIRLTEGWVWCYADNVFFTRRVLERQR